MKKVSVSSLSFDEVRKARTRLKRLGFVVEYSDNPPSALYVGFSGGAIGGSVITH